MPAAPAGPVAPVAPVTPVSPAEVMRSVSPPPEVVQSRPGARSAAPDERAGNRQMQGNGNANGNSGRGPRQQER